MTEFLLRELKYEELKYDEASANINSGSWRLVDVTFSSIKLHIAPSLNPYPTSSIHFNNQLQKISFPQVGLPTHANAGAKRYSRPHPIAIQNKYLLAQSNPHRTEQHALYGYQSHFQTYLV